MMSFPSKLLSGRRGRSLASSLGLWAFIGWCFIGSALQSAENPSIARIWDEEILAAIRIDLPHPPVHARNLFTLSVAMYDAWAAYDPTSVGYVYHLKHTASDVEQARTQAISFAAYRILRERYALSRNAAKTLANLDARMASLGLDTNDVSLDVSTPAGVGNSVAAAVSAYFLNDGSFQDRGYADLAPKDGGYLSVNPPLITGDRTTFVVDVNRWQPLAITNGVSQNGIPVDLIQKFLGSQWLGVRPFSLDRSDASKPWIDPGPPDHLGGVGDADYRSQVVDVIRLSSMLTPDDGVTFDISPGAFGNNTLGANDGTGHSLNPVTQQPYAANVVKRGDFGRILAEFWADGPNSETPPGHWNVIANNVSDHPSLIRRIGGQGPVVSRLEWDVKLYFALNAAVHDAACAAWSVKRYYDGWRPIEAIRYMAMLGQSSDPNTFPYHKRGLPLVPGLIELVSFQSSAPGQRHEGLLVGQVAVLAWPGQPKDPTNQYSGAKWIYGVDWLPYQKKTFVTPAFPGYISGHSTFSRSAAEILTAFTGSAFFPGGMSTYLFPSNSFLTFEKGPSTDIQLQWATYYDAADQAGISRLYGGIHVTKDDLLGRKTGAQCGKQAWALSRQYFDGSILSIPVALSMQLTPGGKCEMEFPTHRGFHYQVLASDSLFGPFKEEPTLDFLAEDSFFRIDLPVPSPRRFFRVIQNP